MTDFPELWQPAIWKKQLAGPDPPPIPPTLLLSEFIVATLWGGVETEWGRELRDMSPSNVSILV